MTRSGSLWVLFGSLLLLQFGYPVISYGPAWTIAYLLIYSGIIAFGIREAAIRPQSRWPLVPGMALLVIAAVWFAASSGGRQSTVAFLAAVGILQLILLVILVRWLMQPSSRARTVDLILIAVSAYLLLGGVFGVIASQIELGFPGSYIDNTFRDTPVTWQALFYASYVTIATLGFGDIVPAAPWARSLSSLEAVLGTLFVAVVIARLVGLRGTGWAKSQENEDSPDGLDAADTADSADSAGTPRGGGDGPEAAPSGH